MRFQRERKPNILLVVAIFIVVGLLLVAGYFAKSYYDLKANPSQASLDESRRLRDAVGKLYALPDEEPVIGKIQDKDKLKDQTFFKNAKNGDDLLIYQEAKLAIIYRASENKLINVGPVSINNTDNNKSGAAITKPSTTNNTSSKPNTSGSGTNSTQTPPETTAPDQAGTDNDTSR